MDNVYKNLHVATALTVFLAMIIITFSSESLSLLLSVFLFCCIVFAASNNIGKLKNGIIVFIPFAIINILINFWFVQGGSHIILKLWDRALTLEALVYSIILSSKLLLVFYIFSVLGIMMDSDRAVSYFSSLLPKSTLTVMIALKLFPAMRKRLTNLKEVYSIRGVDFEDKRLTVKLKSYMLILTVLLEDSLETSFDIGEASYARGFLSSDRSVYDRQKLGNMDFALMLISMILLVCFLILNITHKSLSFYETGIYQSAFGGGVLYLIPLFAALYIQLVYIWRKMGRDELY